jgi:biotin operon repressor
MRRADRLFQLVQLLRLRRAATGRELAETLGVSLRTLYRDIRDLAHSGVPIRGEAGVGYRLDRGFELPPLTFSGAELEGLVLGARMVATWGDAELAGAVRSAMTKIEAVLPEGLRRVLLETALFAPDLPRTQEMSRDVDACGAPSASAGCSPSTTPAPTARPASAACGRSGSTSGATSGRWPPGARCAATTAASDRTACAACGYRTSASTRETASTLAEFLARVEDESRAAEPPAPGAPRSAMPRLATRRPAIGSAS